MTPHIDHLPAGAALARETDLLGQVSTDPGLRFLWFWDSPRALVTPKKLAAKPAFDAAAAASRARGWPVEVRATGGDVTPQGPGVVNVTHVYAAPPARTFDLDREYDRLCAPIEAAFGNGASRGWMPGAFCDGAHNVQYRGRKFAGTAMRFRPSRGDKTRYAVLAHALLLMDPPDHGAIEALNLFLSDLGEGRVIDPATHTGLPHTLTREVYLTRLADAFAADPDLAGTPPKAPA
ncbi:MAG: protein ligase [Pseudomonadota bacterium]